MRSEILGEKEPIEASQKSAERRRRGPGPNAASPKDTEGVLQMAGTCCYLNGCLVAEALATSLRLRSKHMGRLEDWMLDFRRWKISWTPKPHRHGVDECRGIVARKANHQRRRNSGFKEFVPKMSDCRAPKLLKSVGMLRYEVPFEISFSP